MEFRSKLEERVAKDLKERRIKFGYENKQVTYLQPAKKRTYLIDFQLPNGIIVETKGRLTMEDRKKMLWVKQSNPHLDIRFVFERANQKIRKGSKTTYGDWATKNGFIWAEKVVPKEWLEE